MNSYEEEKNKLGKLATEQQLSASNPNMSVWVEASAGTGKTKVLSDRVLRLLLNKVNPSKILCLTYTKAAAVEMNERIANRLSSWAIKNDGDLQEELSKLLENENTADMSEKNSFARTLFATMLDTPGGMKIQTIHSFCEDVLKRFPLEAGISPYFEVLDDRNAKEILQNIKIDLLKNAKFESSSQLNASIQYLTQTISEYKFPEIMNLITLNRTKIGNLLKKYNNSIEQVVSILGQRLGVSCNDNVDDLKRQALLLIDAVVLKQAMKALSEGSKTDVEKSSIFADLLANDFPVELYDKYCGVFFTQTGEIRSKLVTVNVAKEHPFVEDFLRQEAERIKSFNDKFKSLNVMKSTSSVLYIAKNIIDKYNEYKKIYSVLDYEDLIMITRNLLENRDVADWVLFKLDGGIDHILVDEAQDTSPDQWAIIRALTQEFFAGIGRFDDEIDRTVFVVGDRKQSIYSFQGADPKEFDNMFNYFSQRIQKFSKVHLDVSFRSTKAIMDCVNTLFDDPIAKKGVVPENERINHQPFRLGDGGRVEILPLLKNDLETSESDYNWLLPVVKEQKTSISNMLAKQIAQSIKNMVDNKEILASKNRPIRYGDFMFLVQKRDAFVEEFVRACKEIGVNVAGVDKLKLLEQIAVQDLISLGKFLLLPQDDLSLAEVLKSPIFGLNDDDLFELCYDRHCTLFYNLLKNEKYVDVAQKLKELLNMVGFTRPFELFSFVLINMEARKNFVSRMGSEVEDVLDEFLNLSLVFEQQHTPTLEAFILWIVQDEVIIKKEMEQGTSDTVKIMTVHGSKGLQAPIVILGDTTKTKSTARKSDLLWDDEVFYFPTSSANYDKTCDNIKNKNLESDFEEYKRLLYVALTRAEDRLYITGFSKNNKLNDESWYKMLSDNIKSNVVSSESNDSIVYISEQENIFDENKNNSIKEIPNIDYSYLLSPAEIENPLARPYTPSKQEDEDDAIASPLIENGNYYKRGTVIHKLLQYISTVNIEKREKLAFSFLGAQLPEYSLSEHEKIVKEVEALCTAFPEIFAKNTFTEVPIIGEVDGKIMSAKIDRLVIKDDKIIVVDYKTNRPAAKSYEEIPVAYIKQLSDYKKLLKKIYPNKDIETYILWTNTCNMMKL